jgi:hypothetical protein
MDVTTTAVATSQILLGAFAILNPLLRRASSKLDGRPVRPKGHRSFHASNVVAPHDCLQQRDLDQLTLARTAHRNQVCGARTPKRREPPSRRSLAVDLDPITPESAKSNPREYSRPRVKTPIGRSAVRRAAGRPRTADAAAEGGGSPAVGARARRRELVDVGRGHGPTKKAARETRLGRVESLAQ